MTLEYIIALLICLQIFSLYAIYYLWQIIRDTFYVVQGHDKSFATVESILKTFENQLDDLKAKSKDMPQ